MFKATFEEQDAVLINSTIQAHTHKGENILSKKEALAISKTRELEIFTKALIKSLLHIRRENNRILEMKEISKSHLRLLWEGCYKVQAAEMVTCCWSLLSPE